jgi:hypothetical protein
LTAAEILAITTQCRGILADYHVIGPVPVRQQGNLERLLFRSISSLRSQILSSEYHVYACGKMFLRTSILNEISNFKLPTKV